jgi:hypothetical protein
LLQRLEPETAHGGSAVLAHIAARFALLKTHALRRPFHTQALVGLELARNQGRPAN